jgi:DNA mismatch repair protein MutL
MMTCRSDDVCGTEVTIDGGEIESVRDCAKLCGTQIVVENLFHNIPARRKFLKADDTEGAHIVSLVKALSLAEHGVKFSLYQDGSEIFASPDDGPLGDRVNAIFKYNEKFIDFRYGEGEISACGTICDPTVGNICKKNIVSFVNGRLVRSDIINSALSEELAPIFPNHRGILAYILLEIDPAAIDINVHPMKREVRFKSEMSIRSFFRNCVVDVFGNGTSQIGGTDIPADMAKCLSPVWRKCHVPPYGTTHSDISSGSDILRSGAKNMENFSVRTQEIVDCGDVCSDGRGWRFIGTISSEIALFECATGLILFNIRLALRRVTYEKITSCGGVLSKQQLLIPLEISVPCSDEERIGHLLPIFAKYGFSIYPFGKCDYKLDAIPPWLSYADGELIAREFVSDCGEFAKNLKLGNVDEMVAKRVATTVNPESYRTQTAIEGLCDELLGCRNPLLCPLGNAIYFEFPFCEINGRFYASVRTGTPRISPAIT